MIKHTGEASLQGAAAPKHSNIEPGLHMVALAPKQGPKATNTQLHPHQHWLKHIFYLRLTFWINNDNQSQTGVLQAIFS